MGKTRKILTNVQVIIMLVALLLALIAIRPNPWNDGLAIRSIMKNSSASVAGMESPSPTTSPMDRERLLEMDRKPIKTLKEYYDLMATFPPNASVIITTNRDTYRLIVQPLYNITQLNETEEITVVEEMFDEELNTTVNVTRIIEVPKVRTEFLGAQDLGLGLYEAPKTNLRQGLDLSGGSRMVLRPVEKVEPEIMSAVIDSINLRLNAFGLTDVSVRPASDLEGNDFIIIEIAGTTTEELESLARQGNFEAKIGNQTAFKGDGDITYICRTADCSGIDPQTGCSQAAGLWMCRFTFSISLRPEAAQRQADITRDLEILIEDQQNYLALPIDLYLDNELMDSLRIGAELKGNPVTTISISGSGQGGSEEAATTDALNNMRKMQAILSTGSLPVDLEIVKADTISPSLGEEFLQNALLIGIVALVAVVTVVFIRYRRFIVSLPMVFIMLAELFIFLGVAAMIGWNLDVAAIAGIIIAIGTGVNDQIVIADETLRSGKGQQNISVKDKIKKAFFIIFTAYFTIIVAMLPLWFAGAGLLKGFAVTTILGVSVGVFITRPAYAKIIEILYEKK